MALGLRETRNAATIGAIGFVAFGLALGPAVAQSSGSSDGASPAATNAGQGKAMSPGANSGVGATPIIGGGANGNGNVVQGTTGTGGATGTSGAKATEPELKQ